MASSSTETPEKRKPPAWKSSLPVASRMVCRAQRALATWTRTRMIGLTRNFDPGRPEDVQDAIQQDGRNFRVKLTLEVWRVRADFEDHQCDVFCSRSQPAGRARVTDCRKRSSERVSQWSEPGRSLSGPPLTRAALCIGLAISAVCGQSVGQIQTASQYQVEAAYLYNFAKVTERPKQSLPNGSPSLAIAVVGGDDEFLNVLRGTIAGKTIGTHPVNVRRASSPEEMKSCHLVFFRSSERKRTQSAIAG